MGNPALDLEIQILDLYNNAKSKPGLRRSAAKTVRTHELTKKKKKTSDHANYIFFKFGFQTKLIEDLDSSLKSNTNLSK